MTESVIGLIPAAGKGTRLNLPYPKELYPIIRNNRYKPLAQYVVENLVNSAVHDIVFVINETKHQLIGYFGSGRRFGCQFSYVVQENNNQINASTSPGLAHALDSAYHLVCGKTVLFGMADTLMKPSNVFRHLLDGAQAEDQVILGLFEVARPEKFGMVKFDQSGKVAYIDDKPKQTDLKYAWGCIAWKPAFTEHLHTSVNHNNISDFATIMNNAVSQGMPFRAVVIPSGEYADLGTYEEISDLEQLYRG
jgi:glucose-1-phosphate thymidylyltransferase